MTAACEVREQANQLLDEADGLLHRHLKLPALDSSQMARTRSTQMHLRASALRDRLDASFYEPVALDATTNIRALQSEVVHLAEARIVREIRAVTKFRKRVYVPNGGIPMLTSRQLFQVDPIDIKRLAKRAHSKDMDEID